VTRHWLPRLETLAQSALPDFLQRQRWYPAKNSDTPEVALSGLLPFAVSGVPSAVAVWRVTPPGQSPLHLFVPLALVPPEKADPAQVIAADTCDGGREMRVVEAFSVDAFVHAWIDLLLGGGGEASGPVRLRTGRTGHLAEAGLEAGGGWAIRWGSAEQSNTSIRIGAGAILKVIRKVESGVHPELEVGRFLTETAGFTATPSLLGWVELDSAALGHGAVTLSILQAFVPNEGDGWSWVLERLARGAGSGTGDIEAFDEATSWLRRLGRRTAEMHTAFETDTDDPAFRCEPVVADDIRSWVASAGGTARQALDLLADAARLAPQARNLAEALLARRDEVAERLQAMLGEVPAFAKTRHHGDYHLGQVLATGRDAVIIDFEGEPLRRLEERRAKHAALRDVAGMLRSLAYAAAAAERASPPDLSSAEREAVQGHLAAWEAQASQAFVDAYFEAARGGSFCP
jgi:trehalose synthase-fused probable maltokinase